MSFDLRLTPFVWLLAFLPIAVLVGTMLGLRWRAPRAGAVAYLLALALAWWWFEASGDVLLVASLKGLSLALFVLTIIWTSVLLYNIMEATGSMEVIGRHLARLNQDSLAHTLLLAWAFSGFVQGVTGFGVPVAVTVPLLTMVGTPPVVAAVAALVGHSWAVTFGSLGSSYYSLQLVTGLPGSDLAPTMALLFAAPIFVTGLAVAFIAGGRDGVRRAVGVVLVSGLVMAVALWGMAWLGAPQLASTVAGLLGCLAVWLSSRSRLLPGAARDGGPAEGQAGARPGSSATGAGKERLGFHGALLPYYVLLGVTLLGQAVPVDRLRDLKLGVDYPATTTGLGMTVPAVQDYAAIELLTHPAPILVVTIAATVSLLILRSLWQRGLVRTALERTYRQSLSTTLGVTAMVMMALVMSHAGMIQIMARGLAQGTGPAFPVASPFIGLLGAFMTGSNTNSNVMFGALQVETARVLGLSPVIMASLQSIGGSVGSAATPAKVLLGTALVGLGDREGDIMRRALGYCGIILALIAILGVALLRW